jgi:hypothetical protein
VAVTSFVGIESGVLHDLRLLDGSRTSIGHRVAVSAMLTSMPGYLAKVKERLKPSGQIVMIQMDQ